MIEGQTWTGTVHFDLKMLYSICSTSQAHFIQDMFLKL